MQHFALPFALALSLATPLAADSDPPDEDRGFSLMEEGAQLFLRGLVRELDPALRELEDLAQELQPALRALADEMGPAIVDLMATIDDIGYYEAPEILDNGDIIIRRSPDAPPYRPDDDDRGDSDEPTPEIDL